MMRMSHVDLKELQDRVNALLSAFDALDAECKLLRVERSEWKKERISLIAHNELAAKKVQAILAQLKKMETGA